MKKVIFKETISKKTLFEFQTESIGLVYLLFKFGNTIKFNYKEYTLQYSDAEGNNIIYWCECFD